MRTKYNNELRIENVGEKVTLVGWCSKKRNLGGLVFIDLRDRSGIIQLVVEPDNENYQLASEVKNEYVLKATGHVVERESKNPNLETGDVEVIVEELEILNTAENPPLLIQDQTDALEDTRMKYRYLDLRRPTMQHNLIVRHKTTIAVRNYFDENGFIEIETPYLGKSTPEGPFIGSLCGKLLTGTNTPFAMSSARMAAFLASISAFFLPLILSSYRFCAPLAFRFK